MSNLLLLRYDDIWLAQLTTINERTCLLKFGQNLTILLWGLLDTDKDLAEMLRNLQHNQYELPLLQTVCNLIMQKYSHLMRPEFFPYCRDREEYLGDIIQLIGVWKTLSSGKHKV
ncbi:hypothetical protein H5T87_08950 [bacterium]|nr:hypothetical protein [bacterium]